MQKLLLALVPWMAMATAVKAERSPATVVYTYQGSFTDRVERDGDECLIPISLAENWGWKVRETAREADIQADGRSLRVRLTSDHKIPLSECATQLGAEGTWDPNRKTYRMLGAIRNIEVLFDTLRVNSTLSIQPSSFTLKDPERLVIDIDGAKIPEGMFFDVKNVRVKQNTPTSVRLTYEGPDASRLTLGNGVTRNIELPINQVTTVPDFGSTEGTTTAPKPAPKQDPAMGSGQRVGNPILDEEGKATNLKFPLEGIPGPAASIRALSLIKFQILVPGANRTPGEIKLSSRLIEEISADRDPANNLILLVTLKRPATVQFTSKPQAIVLSFIQPAKSDGTLLGKTICLDAGHGGKDSGTDSVNHSVFEKNLTLPTTLMLAKKLTEAGANVVLCRNDDSYPSLTERAAIANRNNADLFVSIHYNSNNVANTASGIMVFYHGKSELGKLLAECINTRIKMKGLLPDRGAKSDFAVYKNSGFSVLRNTTMTGVLCELGFLSHSHDLSVVQTTAFRESVTDALVEGLRTYFGDTKDLETK